MLPHVLERGELGPQHVDYLARDIAAFHGVIEVDGVRGRFGEPENIWKPMEANFQHLEQSLDDPGQRSQRSRTSAARRTARSKRCFYG